MAESPQSNRAFFATALVVIGLIWMALTGLCTAGFIVSTFFGGATDIPEIMSVLTFVLMVGALCIAPGFLLWLGGKALRQRKAAERSGT